MTSKYLAQIIGKHRLVGEKRISIEPERVYYAGTLAQIEILSELKILEAFGNLALVAGQERYQFPAVTITAVSDETPVNITAAGHLFNTGDSVYHTGITALLNRKWVVTKIDDDNYTLDDSVAAGAFVTGTAYHSLYGASEIRSIRKLSPYSGRLLSKTPEQVDDERYHYGSDNSEEGAVNTRYVIQDEPIIVGVRGVPSAAILTEVLFYRRPLPSDALSATVNPIIPSQHDKLLYRGTLYHLLEMLDDPNLEDDIAVVKDRYDEEKQRVFNIVGISRLSKPDDVSSLNWR